VLTKILFVTAGVQAVALMLAVCKLFYSPLLSVRYCMLSQHGAVMLVEKISVALTKWCIKQDDIV